ncbi:MAG: type II secretion system GspH family protein [Candidatus Doudnabacteria bacterium]|nr:type II secretion system GspH family protein [Candidatus Doudnabacteria bacterium]
MQTIRTNESGFTYIELACFGLIVVVLAIVGLSAYASAQSSVRDRQRVSEVTQLQSALKSFYEQNLDFPNSNNGYPTDFSSYVKWPNPPGPADGACTSEQNRYYYTKISSTDYGIAFCLGDQVGNYRAGVRKATPADGIR